MKKIIILIITISIFSGCKEKVLGPLENEPGNPGPVTNIRITNISGGAEIKYDLPADNDLLYVKADYTINNGKDMQVKASLYENLLTVKGYHDDDTTKTYDVTLTGVDRSGNESEPAIAKIQPGLSPLKIVKNSLSISEAFGGASFNWQNEAREPVIFYFMADTVKAEGADPGPLVITRILSSDSQEGEYVERGYPNKPRKFAATIQDVYGNREELIEPEEELTPLLEEKLDKSIMRVLEYEETPVEDDWNFWSGDHQNLIDDDKHWSSVVISFQSAYPRHITVDLGDVYKLSRYVWWQQAGEVEQGRLAEYAYTRGNPNTWYVYTRSEPIDPEQEITEDIDGDGLPDWTNHWTKAGDYELVKPSGLPAGQLTEEDINAILNTGHNFDFPLELPPMRYIRFGIKSNFDGAGWCNMAEIDFYGTQN